MCFSSCSFFPPLLPSNLCLFLRTKAKVFFFKNSAPPVCLYNTPLFLFCLPLKALDRKEKKHPPDEKDMAGFWTTFLHREPIVVWSCALGLVGAALPVCVPPVRNMLRSDAEPTRPPSAASVVAALRGGKS